MNIVSPAFAASIVIVVLAYRRIPPGWRVRFLLVCSYAWYATLSWWFPVALLVLTAVTWGLARRMSSASSGRGWLLGTGIGFTVLSLALLKYSDAAVDRAEALIRGLGFGWDTRTLAVLFPIGMSFYALQAISYLVDAYQKNQRYPTDALTYSLYMAYFPKITSGPIEPPQRLIPQLSAVRLADREQITRGFTLLVLGLFRKTVIADSLFASTPDGIFSTPSAFSPFELGFYLFAYVVAVYNDFAGYTGIVRGISCLLGIELTRNFKAPLFSRSVSELWSRWHISLSSWLRIYIFLPLARLLLRRHPSSTHPANLLIPPLVTMVISGAWHGIGWNFLVWGLLMGLLVASERIIGRGVPRFLRDRQPFWWQATCTLVTMGSVIAACSFFFMGVESCIEFWRTVLFGGVGAGWPFLRLAVMVSPSFALDILQLTSDGELVVLRWPLIARSLVLAVALALMILFNTTQLGTAFVYQGF